MRVGFSIVILILKSPPINTNLQFTVLFLSRMVFQHSWSLLPYKIYEFHAKSRVWVVSEEHPLNTVL